MLQYAKCSAVFGLFSSLDIQHRQVYFLIVITEGPKSTSADMQLHSPPCFSFFILSEANV